MSNNQTEEGKKITQESLLPQRIKKEDKAYQSVLDLAERLKKGDATNIAVTGPYGSGKSSILITLKEDFSEHHYLNISLATLKPSESIAPNGEDKKDDKKDDKKREDDLSKQNLDRLIEYSILQQLVYKEKQDVLPNSRFKRIYHLSEKRVSRITLSVLLAILALIIVFEPTFIKVDWLCTFLGGEWLNIVGDSISIVYLLWFAFKALALLVPAVGNSRINKLNIKNGEIEIVENTSIFNKHLDEILYFFEKTDYDVVILEDLDRFDSIDIFLKLRELNLLLNESKVIGRKITFIYAVRDDLFKDEDRVKCFDYISTVIPIINSSNAKDKLKEELEARGVTDIADVHLRELGFFLRDMRLVKNIANEYVQYRGKLEQGISSKKMLGMIVYKNYYPQDFAQLHDGKGVVYQLLNLKEALAAQKIKEIEDDNALKHKKIEQHRKDRHLKETELRRIYLEAYRDRIRASLQQIRIDDNSYSIKEIAANEKLFEKLISVPNVNYTYEYYNTIHRGSINIVFGEIENEVDPTITFRERLEALRMSFEELEDNLFIDLRKEDVRAMKLSQIMDAVDYSSNPKYIALKVPKAIEYLIVQGYIDEDYYDYISYFYGNFIDPNDWAFVLDLKLGRVHDYDYHINSVEACLEEIPNPVYRKASILNIEILDYLAEHSSDRLNLLRLTVMLRTAIEEKKFDFFAAYYQIGRQQEIVFPLLYGQIKGLWGDFYKNDDKKDSLKLSWFKYAENEYSCVESQNWLSGNYGFITDHLLDIDENTWEILISEWNYAFTELNEYSDGLLKTVADSDSYVLTRRNLELLTGNQLDMNLDSVSLSLVIETENDVLINRVMGNLGKCMRTIFSVPEANNEKEGAILEILLSDKATEDEKIVYLKNQQNKINLEQAEKNEIKALALKCDVVEPSWENVVHYLKAVSIKKTDETLVAFIEKHANEYSNRLGQQIKEDEKRMLLHLLIETNVLAFEPYCLVLKGFTDWQLEGVPKIEDRRVLLLIKNGMIPYTEENTSELLNSFPSSVSVAYLLKYKRDFLKNLDAIEYTTDVAIDLMQSNLSLNEKVLIIPYFDESILTWKLADEIVRLLCKRELNLDYDFLLKVIQLSKLSRERLVVLNYTLEKNVLDEDKTTAFLRALPSPYNSIAEKGKKPMLPRDEESLRLVRFLKERGYISSYTEEKKGIRVNTRLK